MAAPRARVAEIQGRFTAPGINKNRRNYTPEAIAYGVADLQRRIDAGEAPAVGFTSHGARYDDDVTNIAIKPTKVWQAEDGSAWYRGDIPDTPVGNAVAALAANGYATTVSMAANWDGEVRELTDENGEPYQEGERLIFAGFDFTSDPATPQSVVASVEFDHATPAGFTDAVESRLEVVGGAIHRATPRSPEPAHEPTATPPQETVVTDSAAAPEATATPEAAAPVVTLPVADFKAMLADAMAAGAKGVADAVRTITPAPAAPAPAPVTDAAPANAATVADSHPSTEPDEAAVAVAMERLRQELSDKGITPKRAGVVTDAAPAEKPLHEMTHQELQDRSARAFDAELQPAYEAAAAWRSERRRR